MRSHDETKSNNKKMKYKQEKKIKNEQHKVVITEQKRIMYYISSASYLCHQFEKMNLLECKNLPVTY